MEHWTHVATKSRSLAMNFSTCFCVIRSSQYSLVISARWDSHSDSEMRRVADAIEDVARVCQTEMWLKIAE